MRQPAVPVTAALVIMLRSLKMHGMAQAVDEHIQQGSPAFEVAMPVLTRLIHEATRRDALWAPGADLDYVS